MTAQGLNHPVTGALAIMTVILVLSLGIAFAWRPEVSRGIRVEQE